MIPSINDVAADLNKNINNVKKSVQAVADAATPGLEKAGQGAATTLTGLWESGTMAAGASGRSFAGIVEFFEDLQRLPKNEVDGAKIRENLENVFDLMHGREPSKPGLLDNIDTKDIKPLIGIVTDGTKFPNFFDLLALRKNGLVERLPSDRIADLLKQLRDGIKSGVALDPRFNLPGTQFPGFQPVPGNGLNLFNQLREMIAALLERLKQVEAQPGVPGGTTPPAPSAPILNPPVRPGDFLPLPKFPPIPGAPTGDFKKDVLNQIKGLDGQIDTIKDALASGKVPKEDMLTLQLELQELLELKKQLVEMLTSISKSEHEMNMAVIRNLAL